MINKGVKNDLCLEFVKTQIDRKFVKRLFMPLIYGKTVMSMTNDIKQHSGMKLPYKAYFDIAHDCYEFWKSKYPDIVNLMKMLNLVGWFKSQMKMYVVYGHSFYTTHQFYNKSQKTQISIYDRKTKKRHRVTLKINTPERDIRKSQVSTCVNFIHQRDAYIAMLVVHGLKEYKSSASIYTVHDNFITSPYYAKVLHDNHDYGFSFSIPSEYTKTFLDMGHPQKIVMLFLVNNLILYKYEEYNKTLANVLSFKDLCEVIDKKGTGEVKRQLFIYKKYLSELIRKLSVSYSEPLSDETYDVILKEKRRFYDRFEKTLGNFLDDLPESMRETYMFDIEDFRYFLRINRETFCHTKKEKNTWDKKSHEFLTYFEKYSKDMSTSLEN